MGCIFTKDCEKKPPSNYDLKKFKSVTMIFDDLDFLGNGNVSTQDLEQGFDHIINYFFINRIKTLDTIMRHNLTIKKEEKLIKLNENKNDLELFKTKLQTETTLFKLELDDKLEYTKTQIQKEHIKLDNMLKEAENKNLIEKEQLDNTCSNKINLLTRELENQLKDCETIYQNKYNLYNSEKKHLETELSSDNKHKLRLLFIEYMNNNQDKHCFNLTDCLNYYKNKPTDDALLLLKKINKSKYEYIISKN